MPEDPKTGKTFQLKFLLWPVGIKSWVPSAIQSIHCFWLEPWRAYLKRHPKAAEVRLTFQELRQGRCFLIWGTLSPCQSSRPQMGHKQAGYIFSPGLLFANTMVSRSRFSFGWNPSSLFPADTTTLCLLLIFRRVFLLYVSAKASSLNPLYFFTQPDVAFWHTKFTYGSPVSILFSKLEILSLLETV